MHKNAAGQPRKRGRTIHGNRGGEAACWQFLRGNPSPSLQQMSPAGLERLPPRFALSLVCGTLLGNQVFALQRLATSLTIRTEPSGVAAHPMREMNGQAFPRSFAPSLPPRTQGQDHGIECLTLLGEMVLIAQRPLTVGPTLDQAIGLQLLQAGRHHLGRCSGLRLDLVEPVAANEEFPQHQDGPAIPDNRLRSGDWAKGIQISVALHRHVTLFFIVT